MSAHVDPSDPCTICPVQGCDSSNCEEAQYQQALGQLREAMEKYDAEDVCPEDGHGCLWDEACPCEKYAQPDGPYVVIEGLGMLIEEPSPPDWLMNLM